jgi:hypothetical protein
VVVQSKEDWHGRGEGIIRRFPIGKAAQALWHVTTSAKSFFLRNQWCQFRDAM